MDDKVIIRVNNLTKEFKLPLDKNSSIKSAFINFYKHKRGYENQKALKNISFEVKKGEFFGIVGRNGSGKSTLLKTLAGIYVPTSGEIEVRGKLTPFIELGVGFNPELSGKENVFLNGALLGFNRKEMRAMYKDIVEFAELERFMNQKLKNYSSGMQVRLAFSLAIRAQSDILLVDEVLAVGDADFQRKCFDYFKQLKKDKKTVVFVSHDMNAVREFCDKGILLDRGVIKTAGDSKDIAREYALQFMDGYDNEGQAAGAPKRLGNKKAEIISAKARIENGYVVADVSARVNESLDELVYGFHVIGADGVEVTAMNNRMMKVNDIKDPQPGSQIDFQWKMLNVFSDGKYSILLTLVDGSYAQLDYFENAAQFRVKREERSNTAIFPPVEVEYRIQKPSKA